MLTIQKFHIGPDYNFEMPVLATLLRIKTENGNPILYVLVDTSKPIERRRFVIYSEGVEIEEPINKLQYVDSFQTSDGQITFHVFEVTK